MAFTLEDGSAVDGANAYIDQPFFTTHHTDRGRDTAFSNSDVEKDQEEVYKTVAKLNTSKRINVLEQILLIP